MVINIRHSGIVVKDLSKSIKFYEEIGFKLISRQTETGNYIDNLVGLNQTKLEWAKLKLSDNSVIELLKYHSHPIFNFNEFSKRYL